MKAAESTRPRSEKHNNLSIICLWGNLPICKDPGRESEKPSHDRLEGKRSFLQSFGLKERETEHWASKVAKNCGSKTLQREPERTKSKSLSHLSPGDIYQLISCADKEGPRRAGNSLKRPTAFRHLVAPGR